MNIAKQHRRYRAWAPGRHWPRCFFIATGLSAALPHVGLAHVDPDRVVHDPVHDGVGMHPAAEPRVPVLLLELGAEYGRGRAVPQLHQLQQHRPELGVRPVEQPLVYHEQAERPVLADELALAAGPVTPLAPEVLEVGLADVARPHPPGAGGLRERAGQVGLARAGEALENHVLAAPDEPAGRELGHRHPAEAAALEEVDRADVGLGVPEAGPPRQVADLLRDEVGVRLVHRHLDALGERHPGAHGLVLGGEGGVQLGRPHLPELAGGLRVDVHAHSSP